MASGTRVLYTPQNKTMYDKCLLGLGFKAFSRKGQEKIAFPMGKHKKNLKDLYNIGTLTPHAL